MNLIGTRERSRHRSEAGVSPFLGRRLPTCPALRPGMGSSGTAAPQPLRVACWAAPRGPAVPLTTCCPPSGEARAAASLPTALSSRKVRVLPPSQCFQAAHPTAWLVLLPPQGSGHVLCPFLSPREQIPCTGQALAPGALGAAPLGGSPRPPRQRAADCLPQEPCCPRAQGQRTSKCLLRMPGWGSGGAPGPSRGTGRGRLQLKAGSAAGPALRGCTLNLLPSLHAGVGADSLPRICPALPCSDV